VTDELAHVDAFADQLSLNSSDPANYERLMKALTAVVGLVATDLPPVGLEGLDAARRRWVEAEVPGTYLLEHRVACWHYLDAKHGDSTTIDDRQDHAVRAVIALLFEWSDVAPHESLYETADFTFQMAAALGVRVSAVQPIIEQS
jgi:hypothetical protein